MGNLDKVWLSVPEYAQAAELKAAFKNHFGLEWDRTLNTMDTSFAYNALNNTYFAVGNLRPVKNLTLDRLMEKGGNRKPPNVIVS